MQNNTHNWEIVTDEERFKEITKNWEGPVACDVETYKTDVKEGLLLGIALSCSSGASATSIYLPVNEKEGSEWKERASQALRLGLRQWFLDKNLIGHNFTYDKKWIDHYFEIDSKWVADTRLMWHLSSAPVGPKPYGLKDLQIELLGWPERGDKELEEHIASKGGKLKNGDHYLASVEILAKYACLDTYSTLLGYYKLAHFFDHYDYWPLLCDIMAYNTLLEENTTLGVALDTNGLYKSNKRLLDTKEAAMSRLKRQLKAPIAQLESFWKETKVLAYKSKHHKELFLASPERWPKFKWNSDLHKRELFYTALKQPILYLTEGKKPSTNADAVKQMKGAWVSTYLKYEKAQTLTASFSGPYLANARNGRLHPGFNICGTVSYRLSGFRPYLLNAPFDERRIMKHLKCDEGYVGVHADLSAIEPTMTAHYSEEPALLKVFRDGMGDIYLDLALELFPNDKELKHGYDPNIPITKEVKDRFARQRKVAKVIQLAVQYTGTKKTVARNLTKEGIPTTEEEADAYVKAYWRKFRRVAEWEYQLRETNRHQRHLRNCIGRIIRVPDPDYKDLSNRFIQSSAHDALIRWVLCIDKLRKARKVDMKPILIDCHDSTSWQVRLDQVKDAERIFDDALAMVNEELSLSVVIKAERKRFHTLAGLKADE